MKPVILLIGKVCSGKSTYAAQLQDTVCLSVDEWMLRLYPEGCGEAHDVCARRVRMALYDLAVKLAAKDVSVVLDWGFWGHALREEAKAALAGCSLDWRWICPPQSARSGWIDARNRSVASGETMAYIVDEGLEAKCDAQFEPPTSDELPGLTVVRDGMARQDT